MAVQRIRLTLEEREYQALVRLAQTKLRPLEYQLRAMLRQSLEDQGLLLDEPGDPTQDDPQPGSQSDDGEAPRPLIHF